MHKRYYQKRYKDMKRWSISLRSLLGSAFLVPVIIFMNTLNKKKTPFENNAPSESKKGKGSFKRKPKHPPKYED